MEKVIENLKSYPYKLGKQSDFFLASVLQCIPCEMVYTGETEGLLRPGGAEDVMVVPEGCRP